MQNINLEEDFKLVAQQQRKLNLVMKKGVRKEVLKLLEVEMIYAISNSTWVTPVHVVPPKIWNKSDKE